MKKFLSVVLTLMMVFSVFTTVSAEDSLKQLIDQFLNPPANPEDPIHSYELPITIVAKERGALDTHYTASPLSLDLSSGGGVDFKTTLHMDELRDLFETSVFIKEKLSGSALNEFNNGKLFTHVEVTILYPNADVADPSNAGDLESYNGIFTQKGRELGANQVKITYEDASPYKLTVGELSSTPLKINSYLADLTFVLENATEYTTEDEHEITVMMTAYTMVRFGASEEYRINYSGNATYTVSALRPGSSGGTSRYTLTYETNGGEAIDKETYARNAIAKLTKVPKKEGYIFEGWYLDKELTQRVTEVKMTKNTTVYAGWVEDNGLAGSGYDTPDGLNGDDHFAYIVGYPEGDVRPGNNITRAEVTTIFFRLLKENERNMNLAYENSFSDVEILDWYNTAVSTMAKLGIVKGRNAYSFDPNAFITRAEFATICARFADTGVKAENKFTDVAGHWAEKEIYEAAEYGWIRGYEDNTFRPDRFITRAEAMTLINRVLNRVPETTDDLLNTMKKWSDNSDVSAWYYIPVQEATNGHDYNMKNRVYEKWTSLRENIDWTKYE